METIMINVIKNIAYSIISLLSLLFLNSQGFSNYIGIILLFLIIYLFISSTKRYRKNTTVLSIFLGILLILGKYKVYMDESTGFMLMLKLISTFLGSLILFEHIFGYIFDILDSKKIKTLKLISYRNSYIIAFIVISVSWIALLIIKYPGIVYPDTMNQILQVFGDRAFNNKNPLLHTLILKGLYDFVMLFTTDINLATFIVGLVQLIACSLMYAYVCQYIYKRTDNILFYLASLIFYAFVSYNVFYNISISKDALYAAFTVLLICMTDKLCEKCSKKYIIFYVIIGILYCLLRNNGFFSFIIVTLTVCLFNFKFNFKKLTIGVLLILILTTIIRGPFYSYVINNFNKQPENNYVSSPTKFVDSFLYVLPFQQIANVVAHDRELNEKEEWLIEEYIPLDQVKDAYNPMLVDVLFSRIADTCKASRLEIDKIEYIKLWIELFVKYPLDYLEAYVNMNKYYFYPNRYIESMYYTQIYPNDYGIEYSNNNQELVDNIENQYSAQKIIPLVSVIYCPGVVVFIVIICLYYSLLKGNKSIFISMFHLLINFLILMAFVPLNDEFRYIYPIVASLPVVIAQITVEKDYEEGTTK